MDFWDKIKRLIHISIMPEQGAMTAQTKPATTKSLIKSYFPILEWLPNYKREWLQPDLIATLTVWALLVPEAMAYASIAGLPPEAGLYAAPLALLGYAIFGTSRQLVVGPSSTVAALSFVVVGSLAASGTEEFIALSAALAMLVGLILILSGLFKLGFIADFMSKPVLKGFVVGVALTIVLGQLDKLLGYETGESIGFFHEILLYILDLDMLHIPTLIVGLASLAFLFILERIWPRIPWALVLVFLGIIISAALDFESQGIHVVGEIPGGLPPFGLPGITLADIWHLLPGAVGIVLVAYAESLAAAKSYAAEHHYEVDDDQEMIALGASNLGAGFSQGFVVDGSLSRTAAADEAGQKSQMASLVNSGLVLVTAVFLTPLFETLPEAVLGAIVIHAVWRLITFREIRSYYDIRKADFWAAVMALVGVLSLGILQGLILAVSLALLSLLWRASRPSWNLLGRVRGDGQEVFASLDVFPDAETTPGLLIFRFNQQIFFANATGFRDDVRQALLEADQPVQVVLVDAEVIADIDITGMQMLVEIHKELSGAGIDLWFTRVRANVMEYMRRYNLEKTIGPEHFFLSVRAGVNAFLIHQKVMQAKAKEG